MAVTFDAIATTTLSSTASSISFTGISSSYTDLRVICNLQCSTNTDTYLRFNNITTTTYSYNIMRATGSGTQAVSYSGRTYILLNSNETNAVSPWWDSHDIYIPSYSTAVYHEVLAKYIRNTNTPAGAVITTIGQHRSANAINRLDIIASSGTWQVGSTVTLYGILKA